MNNFTKVIKLITSNKVNIILRIPLRNKTSIECEFASSVENKRGWDYFHNNDVVATYKQQLIIILIITVSNLSLRFFWKLL